jgi:putative DNA primase/helicase
VNDHSVDSIGGTGASVKNGWQDIPSRDDAQGGEAPQAGGPGPEQSGTLEAMLACVRAGIGVLPVKVDGSKRPDLTSWAEYQDRVATEEEVRRWCRQPCGFGTIGGKVSGGLEQLDFDRAATAIFPAWRELVEAERSGLVARLNVSSTPKPGYHVRYRVADFEVPGSLKLACDPDAPKEEGKVLIETRGEGEAALAPGSPPGCHPTGRPYLHHSGPELPDVPTLTADEREVLVRCARSFDRRPPPGYRPASSAGPLKPGDDFSRRGPDWSEILTPHGWEVARERGEVRYWRRPGKDGVGWSATTGFCRGKDGADLLHVFSSNADPFENDKSYGKFAAFALLAHNGDFGAAAKELARQGYGERKKTAQAQRDAPAGAACEWGPVPLSPYVLTPASAKRAYGAVTVSFSVSRDGSEMDSFTLSDSTSGRVATRQLFRNACPGPTQEEVESAFAALLRMARARLAARDVGDGKTLLQIARETMLPKWELKFVTPKGEAWSESKDRPVPAWQFHRCVPEDLLDAARQACDLPEGLPLVDLKKQCEHTLEVIWSTDITSLGDAAHSGLKEDSKAARRFRGAVVAAFRESRSYTLDKKDGQATLIYATLAERVKSLYEEFRRRHPQGDSDWRRTQRNADCWWRAAMAGGRPVVEVAVAWTVFKPAALDLYGVADADGFAAVAEMFGVARPGERAEVPGEGTGVVLTREMTEACCPVFPHQAQAEQQDADKVHDASVDTQ